MLSSNGCQNFKLLSISTPLPLDDEFYSSGTDVYLGWHQNSQTSIKHQNLPFHICDLFLYNKVGGEGLRVTH